MKKVKGEIKIDVRNIMIDHYKEVEDFKAADRKYQRDHKRELLKKKFEKAIKSLVYEKKEKVKPKE